MDQGFWEILRNWGQLESQPPWNSQIFLSHFSSKPVENGPETHQKDFKTPAIAIGMAVAKP